MLEILQTGPFVVNALPHSPALPFFALTADAKAQHFCWSRTTAGNLHFNSHWSLSETGLRSLETLD